MVIRPSTAAEIASHVGASSWKEEGSLDISQDDSEANAAFLASLASGSMPESIFDTPVRSNKRAQSTPSTSSSSSSSSSSSYVSPMDGWVDSDEEEAPVAKKPAGRVGRGKWVLKWGDYC